MKRTQTPSFLLELPLKIDWSNEKQIRAPLEAARCLYNALLGEASKRLRLMRNDPAWQKARAIPRTKKIERAQAFSALRKQYHFSEYEMHEFAKVARTGWIVDHIDSTMAQTLGTRAYQAVNRVCVGKAKRVRESAQMAWHRQRGGQAQRCRHALCARPQCWRWWLSRVE